MPLPPANFNESYKAYPIEFASNKSSLEEGNKILLPASALHTLTQMNISYPMLFRVVNPHASKMTHCGVMEFSAPEGIAYLPVWMMAQLELQDEDQFFIKNVELPKGSLVKFQPHFALFTELSNPKAVLEKCLRNFACLTIGDTFTIFHGDSVFPIDVLHVEPTNRCRAVCTIDTDINVDFEEPKDYPEYLARLEKERLAAAPVAPAAASAESMDVDPKSYFDKLGTTGYKLNGRHEVKAPQAEEKPAAGPRTETEVKGKWKYIYRVEPSGERKLIRRVVAAKTISGTGRALG